MTTPVGPSVTQQNKYLSAAIDALDGYTAALAIADQAQRLIKSAEAPAPIPEALNPFTSGVVTEEWVTATIDHIAAEDRLKQRHGILSSLAHNARGTAAGIWATNVNAMLAQLHRDLTGILDEVTTISGRIGDVATPGDAITHDAGAEWKQLGALADEYATLRDAQGTVMNGHIDYLMAAKPMAGGEPHASDLYLRNLDQLWPSWRNPGQIGEQVINIDMSAHRYEPWPTDRIELMLWLVRSDAEPWIPTLPQLDRLSEDRIARANPMPKVIPRPRRLINHIR